MTLRTAFACIMLSALFLVLQAVPAYADIFKKRLPDGTLCFTNTASSAKGDTLAWNSVPQSPSRRALNFLAPPNNGDPSGCSL